MKILVICLLLAAQSITMADSLEIHITSIHFDMKNGGIDNTYSPDNPGIGWSNGLWSVGIYKNSFTKQTVYISKVICITDNFGVEYGVATGYEDIFGLKYQPMLIGYYNVGLVRVRIIPGEALAFGLSLVVKI